VAAIDAMPHYGVVVVATNHDSHAELAAHALRAGHEVFLEKPAVVTADDLALLLAAIRETNRIPELGFSRRFNRLVRRARTLLARENGPFTITCVVKDVSLEPDHWYLWPKPGNADRGKRLPLVRPRRLSDGSASPAGLGDSDAGCLKRAGVVRRGARRLGLLRRRVAALGSPDWTWRRHPRRPGTRRGRRGRLTLTLNDLWKMTVRRDGVTRRDRTPWRDKGHRRMFEEALERLASGRPSAYALRDLVLVSAMQIAATRLVEDRETSVELGGVVRDFFGQAGLASHELSAKAPL
jgi:GFO/IDH/MocA oxidoreductase family protein